MLAVIDYVRAPDQDATELMSAQIISLPLRNPVLLTKKQLAARLGRSERWIELRVREGMPVEPRADRYGRRRYDLQLVEQWLNDRPAKRSSRPDRLGQLEQAVADLAAQVAELRQTG